MELIDKVITKIKEMLNKEYPCDNSEQEVGYASALYELEDFIDTFEVKEVKENLASNDLEYASEKYACRFSSSKYGHDKVKDVFIAGAQWQKKHLWEPSDKQMEAIRIAAEIGTANDSWAMGILRDMYNDLNKLKEK